MTERSLQDVHASAKIYSSARIVETCELKMGEHTFIGDGCFVSVGRLVMEAGSQINAHACLTGGKGTVHLGRDTVISYGVLIITRTDGPKGKKMNDASPEALRTIRSGDVVVGDDAFVGAYAVLMPGVIIGNRAVIGSGTFVSKDIPPDVVVYPEQRLIVKARKRF